MEKNLQRTREIAKDLRLIDDVLFRLAAAEPGVCQEILRTLLDDDELEVISVTPQETIVSLHREVCLDALCRLGDDRIVDIEVQKDSRNDDIRRCRYNASAITTGKTPKGTKFSDIPDVIIVYITEYDLLGNNQAVTRLETCQKIGERYIPVDDGLKIYLANTAVKEDSDK